MKYIAIMCKILQYLKYNKIGFPMVDIDFVLDRLKQFFKVTSDIDLSEKLDLTPTNLAGYKRRKTIPYEHIFNALIESDADLQWIFYGIESEHEKLRTAYIQYYSDIDSSDGNGSINCAGSYEMIQIDIGLFPNTDIKNVVAIKVSNNSMYPTIASQDTIFVDRSKREIEDGKMYIVDINRDITVKRIFKSPKGLIIRSDNKNYPAFESELKDITVIAKVIYKMEYIG